MCDVCTSLAKLDGIFAVFVVAILFAAMIALHQCFLNSGDYSDKQLPKLRVRLAAYASMHEGVLSLPEQDEQKLAAEDGLLPKESHKILLGIIKKIEAKNAVLSALTLPWFAVGIAVLGNGAPALNAPSRIMLAAIALFASYLTFIRLDGNNHLGQANFLGIFRRCGEKDKNAGMEPLIIKMQRELMLNLLKKEHDFYSGVTGLALMLVYALVMALFSSVILNSVCGWPPVN